MCLSVSWAAGRRSGQPVAYITSQGEELLKGAVRIDPDPEGASGILCACCSTVISCSQFEAPRRRRGSRRAPYDNIFTADGLSLRKVRRACCARSMEWHPRGPWHDSSIWTMPRGLVWLLTSIPLCICPIEGPSLWPGPSDGGHQALGSSGCI